MGKLRQYPCGDRESEEREWRAEALKAQQHYRESISGALGALDKEPVLPEARHETPRSDIVGLLRRVSQVSERAPQYVLILRAVRYPCTPAPRGSALDYGCTVLCT